MFPFSFCFIFVCFSFFFCVLPLSTLICVFLHAIALVFRNASSQIVSITDRDRWVRWARRSPPTRQCANTTTYNSLEASITSQYDGHRLSLLTTHKYPIHAWFNQNFTNNFTPSFSAVPSILYVSQEKQRLSTRDHFIRFQNGAQKIVQILHAFLAARNASNLYK